MHLEQVAGDSIGNDSNLPLRIFSEGQNRIMTAKAKRIRQDSGNLGLAGYIRDII